MNIIKSSLALFITLFMFSGEVSASAKIVQNFDSLSTQSDVCQFSVFDYQAKLELVKNKPESCYGMDVVFDGIQTSYSCEETRTGTIAKSEIQADSTLKYLLKKGKIEPASVQSLRYYQVELDDDGGSLIFLKAKLESSETKTAGALSYLGGATAAPCEN